VLESPKFRAGYDFLILRCESGEVDAELGQWWTRFQDASDSEREEMIAGVAQVPGTKRRRRRRGGGRGAADGGTDAASPDAG
jgi:poly(A) polymerase